MINTNNTELTPEDKEYFLSVLDQVEDDIEKSITKSYDRNTSVTAKGGRPYKATPWEIAERGLACLRDCIKSGMPISVGLLAIRMDVNRRQLLNWTTGRSDGKGNENSEFAAVINSLKNFIVGYHEIMGVKARNPYYHIFVLTRMGFGKL